MVRTVRVKILDHEYLIKSDEDEEQIRRIARYVNEKFAEVSSKAEGLSERRRAILVAFNIASDYFQLLRKRDEKFMDIQRRARALNHQIDSVST